MNKVMNNWVLEKLNIEFQRDYKITDKLAGNHKVDITFRDAQWQSFKIIVSPEQTAQMLDILFPTIQSNVEELRETLKASILGVKEEENVATV